MHNGNCLDEATKQQIYKDIYDDSEWLIGVVENLLYVTRLNDGRLKLELTDQLVDEVVNEAVSHLKKKSVGHKVTVRCDDLTKPFSIEELLARLRVTQRRLLLLQASGDADSPVFQNGKLKIDYAAGCAYLNGEELHLTPIEYKLLCLLSHNVGKVLTHTYITQQIWGSSWENDIASLRVFMATLRKKLEPQKDCPQYIQTHIGVGYRMLRVD